MYFFNDLVVDFENFIIKNQTTGKVLQLGNHDFLVLKLLVENAGVVLSKDELINYGWEGKCVSDNSLTQAIMNIRRVLRDDERNQGSITTISGKGYMFEESFIENTNYFSHTYDENKSKIYRLDHKFRIVVLLLCILSIISSYYWFEYFFLGGEQYRTIYSDNLITVISNDESVINYHDKVDGITLDSNDFRKIYILLNKEYVSVSRVDLEGDYLNYIDYFELEDNYKNIDLLINKAVGYEK